MWYKAEKGIYCLLEMLRAIVLVSEFGGLNSDFIFSLNQGNNAIWLSLANFSVWAIYQGNSLTIPMLVSAFLQF